MLGSCLFCITSTVRPLILPSKDGLLSSSTQFRQSYDPRLPYGVVSLMLASNASVSRKCVPPKFSDSGIHVTSLQSNMESDVYSRKNLYVNVVLSGGTNMFKRFERMTKELTASFPFRLKIKVVAPPDVNMFTVGVKRFRHAEVLFQTSFSQRYPRHSFPEQHVRDVDIRKKLYAECRAVDGAGHVSIGL